MAQSPLLTNQLQIEPGSVGTRLISRNATDGSLSFLDPNVSAAINLLRLVGLRNITGLYIVGRGGDGSPYTSIQAALDAATSTPALVMVMAGDYSENLTINQDVTLVGVGGVTITNALDAATITIESTVDTTPESVVLHDIRVVNTSNGQACVAIDGAGTYASGTATVVTAPLAAGDTLEVGGITLTGVAGSRTSGGDNFSISGGTTATVAAEIVAALNDPNNSFAATVFATRLGNIVTVTSVVAGVAGNVISLGSTTVPAGGITLSGANLTGGSASGSTVASDQVLLDNCVLVASGNGGYQIRASTVNNIRVRGGTWRGSSSTSLAEVVNCAEFSLFGVNWLNDLEFAYDSAGDVPSIVTSEYELDCCGRVNNILCDLEGVGALLLSSTYVEGAVTQGGDRVLGIQHSQVGDIQLGDTVAATLINTARNALVTTGGTPTLSESTWTDTLTFAASASEVLTFDIIQPDTSYAVYLDCPTLGSVPQVTNKATAGFTVEFVAPFTGTVFFTVVRQQ